MPEIAQATETKDTGKIDKSPENQPVNEDVSQEQNYLQTLINENPSLAKNEDIKEDIESISKEEGAESGGNDTPSDKEVENQKSENEEGGIPNKDKSEPDEQKSNEEKSDDKNDDDFKLTEKSAFFKKSDKNKVDIKDPNDAANYVKDKYNIDVTDPKNWGKLFNSMDKWRTDAQKYSESTQKYEALVNDIQNLPIPLVNAIQTYQQGGDYLEAVQQGAIDFTKDVSQHNKADLINHYLADEGGDVQEKFDNEDIDEAQYSKEVDRLFSIASKLYDRDKRDFDQQRDQYASRAEEMKKKMGESIESSMNELRNEYPDFGDDEEKEIKNVLKNGVMDKFYNPDGTLRKEAAKRVALMLYGDAEIQRQAELAARKAASQATQDVVSRSDKKPKKGGGEAKGGGTEGMETVLKTFEGVIPGENPFRNAFEEEQNKK